VGRVCVCVGGGGGGKGDQKTAALVRPCTPDCNCKRCLRFYRHMLQESLLWRSWAPEGTVFLRLLLLLRPLLLLQDCVLCSGGSNERGVADRCQSLCRWRRYTG